MTFFTYPNGGKMTFDEAKLALTAHGQEAFKDLFQPCICGMRGGSPSFLRVVTKLPVEPRPLPDAPPKEPCRSCMALQVISSALAVVATPDEENSHLVLIFTSGVEQLYPSQTAFPT